MILNDPDPMRFRRRCASDSDPTRTRNRSVPGIFVPIPSPAEGFFSYEMEWNLPRERNPFFFFDVLILIVEE